MGSFTDDDLKRLVKSMRGGDIHIPWGHGEDSNFSIAALLARLGAAEEFIFEHYDGHHCIEHEAWRKACGK